MRTMRQEVVEARVMAVRGEGGGGKNGTTRGIGGKISGGEMTGRR